MEGVKYFDLNRREKCEQCPHKKAENEFRRQTEELIASHFPPREVERFKFAEFENVLYAVLSLEDLAKYRQSIKTEALLVVYEREKLRFDRIEDLQREEGAKN